MILFHFLPLIFFLAWSAPTFAQNIERAIITYTSESISLAPLLYGIEKGFYRKEARSVALVAKPRSCRCRGIFAAKEIESKS